MSILEWIVLIVGFFIAIKIAISGKGKNEIISEVKAKIEGKGRDEEGNIKPLNLMAQIWLGLSLIGVIARYRPIRAVMSLGLAFFIVVWLTVSFMVAFLLFLLLGLIAVYWIVYYFYSNSREIEADPPHLGLLTVLGERQDIVLKEGRTLRVPGIIDFIEIKVDLETLDIPLVPNLYSKDGVSIMLENMALVYFPDPNRLIQFINAGRRKGVEDAVEDLVPDRMKTWTGSHKMRELLYTERKEVQREILSDLTGIPAEQITTEGLVNGISDGHLLGIRIRRFTIGPVEDEGGEYTKALKQQAIEEIQRGFETFEKGTELLQAEVFQEWFEEKGEPVSYERALRMVLDYKALREDKRITPGLGDLLSSGISLLELGKAIMSFKEMMRDDEQ